MSDKKSMPGWFTPLLALSAIFVALSGLNLLKSKRVIEGEPEEEKK